jgi:DNA-binding NtrC family response regulator
MSSVTMGPQAAPNPGLLRIPSGLPPSSGGGPSGSAEAPKARVLLVDDEPSIRRNVPRLLLADGFAVDTAEDGPAALDLLATRNIDVMLLDAVMPSMSGMDVLGRVKQLYPDVEVVMMTAFDDADAAAAAVRAGAYDVLVKPFPSPAAVSFALQKAADHRRLQSRARSLEQRLEQHERFGELVGSSAAMQEVYRKALGVAPTSSPVLILGENGTGKELVARAIHQHSTRADRPFRVLSCGAVPEALIDAELFGAEGKPGLFELCDKGTLLLDEVEDLPASTQAALGRALADRAMKVRVLAAGSADLKERVSEGQFREDLYYRLAVFLIHLPPLRRRREDIPLLAYHFLQKHGRRAGREVKRISVEAVRLLRDYPWPGNVRELENAIEYAVVMARGDAVLPADLPLGRAGVGEDAGGGALLLGEDVASLSYADAKDRAVDAFDKLYVEKLMKRAGGNVSEAARQAGMDRSNFRRLLKKVRSRPKG